MKRDIAISGVLGLFFGPMIFFFANWVKSFIPTLISDFISALVIFLIMLFFALAEIPVMVFAIRKLSQTSLPRWIVLAIFMFFVSFAAVYALIFMLLTDTGYSNFGLVLAGLSLARFCGGVFIK